MKTISYLDSAIIVNGQTQIIPAYSCTIQFNLLGAYTYWLFDEKKKKTKAKSEGIKYIEWIVMYAIDVICFHR